jgi:hypothetical protein
MATVPKTGQRPQQASQAKPQPEPDAAASSVDADRFPHAAKANREPSEHEVAEVEAREAFEALPLEGKIKALLDPLIVEVQHQVDHNAPVTASIITQLRVIRALLDDGNPHEHSAEEGGM